MAIGARAGLSLNVFASVRASMIVAPRANHIMAFARSEADKVNNPASKTAAAFSATVTVKPLQSLAPTYLSIRPPSCTSVMACSSRQVRTMLEII